MKIYSLHAGNLKGNINFKCFSVEITDRHKWEIAQTPQEFHSQQNMVKSNIGQKHKKTRHQEKINKKAKA